MSESNESGITESIRECQPFTDFSVSVTENVTETVEAMCLGDLSDISDEVLDKDYGLCLQNMACINGTPTLYHQHLKAAN
eukprot:CAMPEP_0113297840 /NCGR_PEP_ID=MMETSP0010_2-20120614/530_1 /TAXON_ID=216773 ORGANISM="Corethron hystrix, Strain 308" /NCGR_SAMPLE_ID=MMETSP0010_2 /ASSEMBLY_ACC=CAM_ASM_000155 /LENGTH=79 /DNA_ID=CAMNT_0000150787 /DNA_START=40 /DNA_END=279 /DNA_ORIENTATION=+ /assembly_acc=CAM_ASM_000155